MVEEQIEEKLVAAHLKAHLAAHEGETGAQLEQEVCHVFDQRALDLAFLCFGGEAEKVEAVGVFEGFAGEIGLRFRESQFKIRHRLAAALPQPALDLHDENVARPIVLNGFA